MKGFTLLEVMISLAIIAGVVLTVITSFNYHLSLAAQDREETIALLLARSRLDDPDFNKQVNQSGVFAPDWPTMGWKTEITPSDFLQVNKMTLTVFWDDQRKKLSLVQYQAAP
jgi:general secretion pathway protein I